MFSLILTVVAVALVAALAMATLFYGGEVIHGGNARAIAGTVMNQGEQIVAAARLYYVNKGVVAPSLAALVAEGYLNSIPVPPAGLQVASFSLSPISSAYAADTTWEWDAATETLGLVRQVTNSEVCSLLNEANNRTGDIQDAVDTTVRTQCYGDSQPYTVLWNAKVSMDSVDGTLEAAPDEQLCQGATNLGHTPAVCAPNATGGPVVATPNPGLGTSESNGLRLTTSDPLTFKGATYWVTNEIRTVTLTNTSGANQWLNVNTVIPEADPTWGPRVGVLDTTCPEWFLSGDSCTVRLIRPPYSNINRSALAETVAYRPSYVNDNWEPIGTPPSLAYQVAAAFDTTAEVVVPVATAESGNAIWIDYSSFLRNTVQGSNEGSSISLQYPILIYPTSGQTAWDYTVSVGYCHYPNDNEFFNAGDFTADNAKLTCFINPGTPPGIYEGWRRMGADQYVLCPSQASQWGQSCSGTDYGYYRFRLVN